MSIWPRRCSQKLVKVDHYCLGALLYELVTGLPPYYSRDTDKIYESVLNEDLTFPDKVNLSPEIRDLLEGLLCKQPAKRLGSKKGLSELLQHAWFKDVDFVAMLQKKIPPPFKPDQLKFNYDSNDLMKGELETREKLLVKAGFQQDIRIFKQFYYDSKEPSNILNEHLKEVSQLSRKNSLQKRIKTQFENFRQSQLLPSSSKLLQRITYADNNRQNTLPQEHKRLSSLKKK